MGFLFDSTSLRGAKFNGVDIKDIYYNGEAVWSAADNSPFRYNLTTDGEAYEIGLKCDGNYTFTSKVLELPISYNGKPIRGISQHGFDESDASGPTFESYVATVDTLIIPDGENCYTYIADKGFANSHLKRVEIKSTRMADIGEEAFIQASSLTSINLDAITASLVVGYKAFDSCENLLAITFPASTKKLCADSLYICSDSFVVYFKGCPTLYSVFGDDSWGIAPLVYCNFNEDAAVWTSYSDASMPEGITGWSASFRASISDWQIIYDYAPSNDYFNYDGDPTYDGCQEISLSIIEKNEEAHDIVLPITHDGYPVTSIGLISYSALRKETDCTVRIPASIGRLQQGAIQGFYKTESTGVYSQIRYDGLFGSMDSGCFEAGTITLILPWLSESRTVQELFNSTSNANTVKYLTMLKSNRTKLNGEPLAGLEKISTITLPDNITSFQYGYFYGCDRLANFPLTSKIWRWTEEYQSGNDDPVTYIHYLGNNTGTSSQNTQSRIRQLALQGEKNPDSTYSMCTPFDPEKMSFTGGTALGYNGANYYWNLFVKNNTGMPQELVLSCAKGYTSTGSGATAYDPHRDDSIVTRVTVEKGDSTVVVAIPSANYTQYSRPYVFLETQTCGAEYPYYHLAYPSTPTGTSTAYVKYSNL